MATLNRARKTPSASPRTKFERLAAAFFAEIEAKFR
jgi:hypothetical protein